MRMSMNEFLEYTKNMSDVEYHDFIEYASDETVEEPYWLAEFRMEQECER